MVEHKGRDRGNQPSGFMCKGAKVEVQQSWATVSHGSSRSPTAAHAQDAVGESDSWNQAAQEAYPLANTVHLFVKFQEALKLSVAPTQDKLRPLTPRYPHLCRPISYIPTRAWEQPGCSPGTQKGALTRCSYLPEADVNAPPNPLILVGKSSAEALQKPIKSPAFTW